MNGEIWDWIDSIGETKKDLVKEGRSLITEYEPYFVNRAFSQFIDSVLYVNEMNIRRNIPVKAHYDYLRHSLRPKRRRTPWAKADAEKKEKLNVIANYMEISLSKAAEYLPLIDNETIERMRKATGGTSE